MTEEQHLECEMEELRLEIKENAERIDNLCNLLKQNNTKLRKLKEMNHRTPPKYNIDFIDDKMVIVNGVEYQRVEEPKPQTLMDIILNWWVEDWTGDSKTICEELVNRIESKWLSNRVGYDKEEPIVDVVEYHRGWDNCLKELKGRLRE